MHDVDKYIYIWEYIFFYFPDNNNILVIPSTYLQHSKPLIFFYLITNYFPYIFFYIDCI